MRSNILINAPSLLNIDNLEMFDSSLAELLLTRNLAKEKGDLVFKPGGWNNIILDDLISRFDRTDRTIVPAITQKLRMLFDSNSFALDYNPVTIEELNGLKADRPNAFLGVFFEVEDTYLITNRNKWYLFHYNNLIANPPTIINFCTELSPYFKNLYLNPFSIPQYLNTLHCGSHIPIMRTIMHHLDALENKFYSLFKQHRREGLPRVCERFEIEMNNNPIPFGCSTDRDNVGSLEIEFVDPDSQIRRVLYCDPHTKIWGHLEDGISDDGDRIYFYQPEDDFINGKVLIARIGRHR